MRTIKYTLIAALSVFFITTSTNAKEVTVEALGVGSDYDWAVLSAIENAVRQNSTVYVEKTLPEMRAMITVNDEAEVKDGKEKSGKFNGNISGEIKTIEAYYQGKVKSYRVLSMEEKNDKVYVTIEAKLDVVEEYKSPELEIKKPDYSLAVMPFKGLRTYSCGRDTVALNVVNNNIANSINQKISKTKKFSIVNRDDLYDYANEMSLEAAGLTKEKNKIGNLKSADYMIVGTINEFQSYTNTKTIDVTGESFVNSFAKIVVNYSLVETATMEVLFTDTTSASLSKEGQGLSCEGTLRDVTDKLADEISNDIMKALFPNYVAEVAVKTEKTEQKAKSSTTTTTTTTTKTREVVKLPFDN